MLKRIVVMLVFGSMLLAACGGDDGGALDGGGDGGGDVGGDGGGDVGVIDSAQCAEVASAMAAAAQAIPAAFSGSASDLETSIQQMQAFADAAPDEISGDLQTIYEAYATFAQVLADSGYDPASGQAPSAEVIAAMEEASSALNSEEVTAASARVSAFFEGGCGA